MADREQDPRTVTVTGKAHGTYDFGQQADEQDDKE